MLLTNEVIMNIRFKINPPHISINDTMALHEFSAEVIMNVVPLVGRSTDSLLYMDNGVRTSVEEDIDGTMLHVESVLSNYPNCKIDDAVLDCSR